MEPRPHGDQWRKDEAKFEVCLGFYNSIETVSASNRFSDLYLNNLIILINSLSI